jgi:hypothetical protein
LGLDVKRLATASRWLIACIAIYDLITPGSRIIEKRRFAGTLGSWNIPKSAANSRDAKI